MPDIVIPSFRSAQRAGAAPVPVICWVLISAIHYHDARLDSFARQGRFRPHMIQLTSSDLFAALSPRSDPKSFRRETLFPNASWREIDPAALVARLNAALDAANPAVVCINGWSEGGCIASLNWCLRRGVPAVLLSDSNEHDERRQWWKEAIKRRIVRLCSAALIAGQPQRRYIGGLGMAADMIFDGYDVVDNDHFDSGARSARRNEALMRAKLALPSRYFLACCRFETKKNLAGMLQSYAAYRKSEGAASWPLIVLGDGSLRPELERLRSELGLDDCVQFPGFKGYDELPAYYGLAGGFLHLSTVDQWGLVVNEAMASGLPVIVSNRCGCADNLVDDGINGYAVDPNNIDQIATAMARLSSDPTACHAMAKASRRKIHAWGAARFAQNLAAAVDAAMQAPRPAFGLVDRLILRMMSARSN